jgi:hypothetical protein
MKQFAPTLPDHRLGLVLVPFMSGTAPPPGSKSFGTVRFFGIPGSMPLAPPQPGRTQLTNKKSKQNPKRRMGVHS